MNNVMANNTITYGEQDLRIRDNIVQSQRYEKQRLGQLSRALGGYQKGSIEMIEAFRRIVKKTSQKGRRQSDVTTTLSESAQNNINKPVIIKPDMSYKLPLMRNRVEHKRQLSSENALKNKQRLQARVTQRLASALHAKTPTESNNQLFSMYGGPW